MGNLSKYDVLSLLSKKMPFFAATQWLKTPNGALANEAPSELINRGEIEIVYKVLETDINSKNKNGTRSD